MKSQTSALLHVMQGIRKDIQASYPAMKGLGLDFERLALYCQTRGIGVFTLDLPVLDALLLQGLETGRLVLNGPFTRTVSKRVKVPRLFSGLWLRVFDRDACLRQDVDVSAIFFLRQLCCLGKKLAMECSPLRIQSAVENYHVIEQRLRNPSLGWDYDTLGECQHSADRHLGDHLRVTRVHDLFWTAQMRAESGRVSEILRDKRLLDQCQQVADLIAGSFSFFEPVTYSESLDRVGRGIGFKHGLGAVSERYKNWEKSEFKSWPDKLEDWFPYDYCGKSAGSPLERPSHHEKASRLICVPKTAKGPRLIASEPASHMWCQQLIRQFLVDELKTLFGEDFICFQKQQLSGDLVLDASRDRKLATVDLSDASDRLSCWTVERIFRRSPSVLSGLHAARTRYLRDDISRDRSFLKLKKFASQGTATTFPVQSIVFLCLALGACIQGKVSMQKILRLSSQVRVYGDDIIIPTHGYERLVRIMDLLELKVNIAKSYVNGHFRESCGVDGYMGYDVTPVKPKTLVVDSPASCQAVIDTCNNLFNKGLWHASEHLRSHIPARIQRGIRIVGPHDAGYSGLSSYSGGDESHLKTRWNQSLHRYEVRVWSISDRPHKRERGDFPALLDFFASIHSHEHARTVSNYAGSRKTRDGFLWEPCCTGTRDDICKSWQRKVSPIARKSRGVTFNQSILHSDNRRLRINWCWNDPYYIQRI
jgi:hypothetical protein